MKKLMLALSALVVVLGLAACSGKEESKVEKKSASTDDVKKELVKFYMALGNKINAKDVDLNSYIAKATAEDAKPEDMPTAEDRAKASEAATAVSGELKSVKVPEALKEQKTDLEAAIKDYAAAYQAKAEELKKDTPSLDEGEELFTKAEEELGKVFESAKLLPPSLAKQVN